MNNQQFSASQPMQPAPATNNNAYPYATPSASPYAHAQNSYAQAVQNPYAQAQDSYAQAAQNPYAQTPQNPYMNNQMYQTRYKVKEETPLTKSMKSQFSFFGLASAVYALFYTFCLYKNASGITYPFFIAGTLYYFFLSMKKLGVPYKKDSLFYVISIMLLGISNCCTGSPQLLGLNKLGIFLLAFVLMLHTIYQDKSWGFPKYISAIFHTIINSFACIFSPFIDIASFFDAKKQEKTGKNSKIIYVIIGLAFSVPVLALMTALLCSADIVFRKMISRLFSFDFQISEFFKIGLLIAIVFSVSYALLSALCKKSVKEEASDKKIFEPIIAIITTGMLSVVYLMFSMIQILYLFIGNMKLPEGYTYSSYARQGFFQLLAVCIINLVLVLFCLSFFKDNIILKIILTIISGCTFIMILSSALRMLMYIKRYNLTFLRILVLWGLAVIFLLMTGVTIYIYKQNFPLFSYSVVITTILYIGLSFAHPDYWIARYNINPSHLDYLDGYDIYDSQRYLSRLSTDAAPILLDERNPYLPVDLETMKKSVIDEKKYDNEDSIYMYNYYRKVYNSTEKMHIRNFNFSIFIAKQKAGL